MDEHEATVFENRGNPLGKYDPYIIDVGTFLVGCKCGWYAGKVGSLDEAFTAARAHTSNVKPEVESLFPDS